MLVPDISARQVQIRYSFTGAQLLLFGAVVYPGGRPPDRQVDIAVVLRGPVQPILVREKQKIAGIWMNADSNRFRSAPSFYAVASSRPIASWSMSAPRRSTSSGCTICSCRPAAARFPRRSAASRPACSTCAAADGLYSESPHGVEITGGVLYRAVITIPSQVPVGTYTAETFLIDRHKVIAAATRDIQIDKSGFERTVAARRPPPPLALWPDLRRSCRWASAGPRPPHSAAASKRPTS